MGIYVGNKRYAPYIGDNRRRYMGGKSLPYDAEIEYLESTGTQYINTLISPEVNCYIDIVFNYTGTQSTDVILFGANNGNSFSGPCVEAYKWGSLQINYYRSNKVISFVNSEKLRLIKQANVWTLYDESEQVLSTYTFETIEFNLDYPIYLFGLNRRGNAVVSNKTTGLRIYSFKLKNTNNIILFDSIPVRVGTTGYLYDRVSQQLFGNAGTGDFVLGPDKT